MRIGIDARPLQNPGTKVRGIGKYTNSLLIGLSKLTSKDEIIFYCNAGDERPEILKAFRNNKVIEIPKRPASKNKYLRVFRAANNPIKPKRREVDLLLQTDPDCGIPSIVPTVAVFNDLIPLLFRNVDKMPIYTARGLKHLVVTKTIFKRYMDTLRSYKNAAAIVAISESSRRDYLHYLDKKAGDKIFFIGGAQAITGTKISKSDEKILNKLGLTNTPYMLYVGGIERRKNVMQLIYDLVDLLPKNPDLKLVVVGKEFELSNVLKGLGWDRAIKDHPQLKKAIIKPGYLTDGEVKVLLKNAKVFPFPSLYEGFGLPPLEAMDAGCPVICYDNSSLPEVVGNAALLVKNGQSLAPAIQKVLQSKKLQDELKSKGSA